jgi:hypothetical protein
MSQDTCLDEMNIGHMKEDLHLTVIKEQINTAGQNNISA